MSRDPAGSGQHDPLARPRISYRSIVRPQVATLLKLARYWATEYGRREVEARLNVLSNFVTQIDRLDIHFSQVRSRHRNALPLIVTHGRPGSGVEQPKIAGSSATSTLANRLMLSNELPVQRHRTPSTPASVPPGKTPRNRRRFFRPSAGRTGDFPAPTCRQRSCVSRLLSL